MILFSRMVVEGPIFRRQKINFSPTGEMNSLMVTSKKAFMIINQRQLVVIDVNNPDEPQTYDIVRSGNVSDKFFMVAWHCRLAFSKTCRTENSAIDYLR